MKFKFPLQKVLEHRKLKENLAQKDFQDVVVILNEQQAVLEKMHQDVPVSYTHLTLPTKA